MIEIEYGGDREYRPYEFIEKEGELWKTLRFLIKDEGIQSIKINRPIRYPTSSD